MWSLQQTLAERSQHRSPAIPWEAILSTARAFYALLATALGVLLDPGVWSWVIIRKGRSFLPGASMKVDRTADPLSLWIPKYQHLSIFFSTGPFQFFKNSISSITPEDAELNCSRACWLWKAGLGAWGLHSLYRESRLITMAPTLLSTTCFKTTSYSRALGFPRDCFQGKLLHILKEYPYNVSMS